MGMDAILSGKNVIITGTSQGIGKSMVKAFAEVGGGGKYLGTCEDCYRGA